MVQNHFENAGQEQTHRVIRIGARALAEYVHRAGGLASANVSDLTAQDGARAHRRFFATLGKDTSAQQIDTEAYLEGEYVQDGVTLTVSGRADAVAILADEDGAKTHRQVIEVKTVQDGWDTVAEGGEKVHWAQALLYAYMLARLHDQIPVLQVSLYYVSVEGQILRAYDRSVRDTELSSFFEQTCAAYLAWATRLLHDRLARDRSAVALRFPYLATRAGQEPFMRQVLAAIKGKEAMLIQAPTGIGKTMSALYPAVKAIAHHRVQNVFYLTAKASTRQSAEQALDDMRAQGLVMKSITLYAKESLCLNPDNYCDTRQCPYAIQYYERVRLAMERLTSLPRVLRDDLLSVSRACGVCPFELSLDFSLICDVVICDYNYVFDPRVRLQRYFDESMDVRRLLLVDEAHNLPDRSREMFSAQMDERSLVALAKMLHGLGSGLDQPIRDLVTYFGEISSGLRTDTPLIDQVEKDVLPASVLVADRFRATRQTPQRLQALLWRFVRRCEPGWLDRLPAGKIKRAAQTFFFDALFFLKVADEFYDPAYVTSYAIERDICTVRLMCLDASTKLSQIYFHRFATVFFSATLSPLRYFERMLSGRDAQGALSTMTLPSPFPPENLMVCTVGTVGTRYRQRQETAFQVASVILTAVEAKVGNYLIFLPSFAYLRQIHTCFLSLLQQHKSFAPTVMIQSPQMDETARWKFLSRFNRFGETTLVAFAVLGGVFGEGIDLAGEQLSGVVIVGTGLPMFCPERELMREYYQQTMEGGFEYAYMYPGFNKVQQAAGRVIRSENDRGFVILIDDRYLRREYAELMPEDWNPQILTSNEELADAIARFA